MIAILVLGAAALWGYSYVTGRSLWQSSQTATIQDGPAVFIRDPAPGFQIANGDTFVVFVSASDDAGVTRLDLWVDNLLVLSQSSPESGPVTPLNLTHPLMAIETGTYALVARAYNRDGVMGESLVHYVTVYEASASTQEMAQYVVQEGDTVEKIASKGGTNADAVRQANPSIPPGGQVKPGQVVVVPVPPRQPLPPAQPAGQAGGQAGGQIAGQQPGAGVVGILPGQLPVGQLAPGQLQPNQLPGVALPPPAVLPNGGQGQPAPNASLAAPTSLQAKSLGNCKYELTWTDNASDETSYLITSASMLQLDIATLKADAQTYQGIASVPGKHGFKVVAQRNQGGQIQEASSSPVWLTIPPAQGCESSAAFKRLYFQPVVFQPGNNSSEGFLHVAIENLPAFRLPPNQQTYLPAGNYAGPPLRVPAPESFYTQPDESISVGVYGSGKVGDKPVALGSYLGGHTYDMLTNQSDQTWSAKGDQFSLQYKFWLEDWFWNGQASNVVGLVAPYDLVVNTKDNQHVLSWEYDKKAYVDINGFIVYRFYDCADGTEIQYPLVVDKMFQSLSIPMEKEPVGCSCNYQVSAFSQFGESERSARAKGTCNTSPPLERLEVTFENLHITSSIAKKLSTGEIYLYANEIKRQSGTILLQGTENLALRQVALNGQPNNNTVTVDLRAGSSPGLNLDFYLADICKGNLFLTKENDRWVSGSDRIMGTNANCWVDVTINERPLNPSGQNTAKSEGQACSEDKDCWSGNCDQGWCAPAIKGGADSYCFDNQHCISGVCDCHIRGEIVNCPPQPVDNPTGFCRGDNSVQQRVSCQSDGNCDDGEFCNAKGFCTTLIGNGPIMHCTRDGQCASGNCAEGICAPQDGTGQPGDYCHHNNHCANAFCVCPKGYDGDFCKYAHIFLSQPTEADNYAGFKPSAGYCADFPGLENGKSCSNNDDCKSRYCTPEKLCAPKDGTGLAGEYCFHNNHCRSGACDCPSDDKTDLWGFCPGWELYDTSYHGRCTP